MGAQSVEGELESLNRGHRRAAESAQAERHSGRPRDYPCNAAESFDRGYAQTGLHVQKVIRVKGSIRSQVYRRWCDPIAFIKSWQLCIVADSKGLRCARYEFEEDWESGTMI